MQIVIAALFTLLYVAVVAYALVLMTRLVDAVERIARRIETGPPDPPRLER